MSQQAVGEFLKRIDDDVPFREEFFTAVPRQLSSAEPIVEFAGRHGFEFTEQEFQQAAAAVASESELSDAQLGSVAGGGTGGTGFDRTSQQILLSVRPGSLPLGDLAAMTSW